MICKLCRERKQTWSGSKPICSFKSGVFSPEGWNCATANIIRDVPKSEWEGDDQRHALIDTSGLYESQEFEARALWIGWYKNRGRTEAMWLLFDEDREPRRPTEAECLQVAEWYKGHE